MLKKELPVYSIVVDEAYDLEVDKVSIVGTPAMESNFLKFSKDKSKALRFESDERMELLGVALIPDVPIYRNVDGKEFYVVFSKETIREIAQNLFKKGYNTSMNVEHSEEDAESFIYQSFITDEGLGIEAPKGFDDLPYGSWFIGVKVLSPQLWMDIKSGVRNGFSVEGLFGLTSLEEQIEEAIEEEEDLTESYEEFNKIANSYQRLLEKFK